MHDPRSLLAERIRQLARAIPAAAGGGLVVAALALISLWPSTPHRWLLAWLAALLATSALRLGLYLACRDQSVDTHERLQRRLLGMRIASAAAGACWGAIALIALPAGDAAIELIAFMIAGITAAASAALSADRWAAQLFQWPAILPMVLRLLTASSTNHAAMAAMGLMYAAYLAQSALRSHREFSRSTVLKLRAVRDQRQLREGQRRYRALAHSDPLTDLPNRLALAVRLPPLLERAERTGRTLALLYIDLDNFKDINDTHGHRLGDQVLVEVAQRLRASVGEDDLIVRMGGDEFVIVTATPADRPQIEALAHRLLARLAAPVQIEGSSRLVQASIGIALCPQDGIDAGFLLRAADLALYDVKARGRNGYQFFRAEMSRRLEERVFVAEAIRTAIAAEQFFVEYQPLVELATGRVLSFEALLRWRHPERGLIPPGDFIPIAEQCGFIDEIGDHAIRLVCRQLRAWLDEMVPVVPVAVNVSARQIERRGFVERLTYLAALHEVDPALLRIEITESALMVQGDAPTEAMLALQRLGVRIAIDDFGTGYCHLAYLKRLPIDCLKIDRSFVRDMERDPRNDTLLGAIIGIGRSFSLTVVAEGVETARQVELLRALGCECAQGYFFHRPVGAERARELLDLEAARPPRESGLVRPRVLTWRGSAAS
ncbi:MAG: EAL domain-containing protein [Gammaproteobacteria bacterium]|nr:EAL domain-containing protein [Gammaproteobacteria bacterium]